MSLIAKYLDKLAQVPGAWPELKMTPQPHQENLAQKIVDQPDELKGMLASHSLGSGKTFSSILAAHRLGKPIVAIVPASLRENYKKELEAAGFKGDSLVISYDQARTMRDDPEFLEKAKGAVVVYDEAHRMGDSSTATSKVSKLPASKKLFMTGSPIRNYPHELIPLINASKPGALPNTRKEFNEKYLKDVKVKPGIIGKIMGAKPGSYREPKNLEEFEEATKGVVDDYQASLEHYPSTSEEHVDVDMGRRQQAAYDAIMRKNPGFAYKLKHGIPPDKKELHKYRQFLVGLRQVGNTPREFTGKFDKGDDTKIQRMADEIAQHHSKDPHYKGLAYSNYLKSGVHALKDALAERGIEAGVYSGQLNDKEKKELVQRYNKGELPTLLISGAGAEGLDLKGTKHVLIAEPHWNAGRIDQVLGRAKRYKSHTHLPESERHVHIQRFFAKYPQTSFQRVLGLKAHRSADDTLYSLSVEKKRLNDKFLGALKRSSTSTDALNAAAIAAKHQAALRGTPAEHKRNMTKHVVNQAAAKQPSTIEKVKQ